MKQLRMIIHPKTQKLAVAGLVLIACAVTASCVFYLGAGRVFDYYLAKDTAEVLLTASRPLCIGVCSLLLIVEHRLREKED